jgi:hypothetical protein
MLCIRRQGNMGKLHSQCCCKIESTWKMFHPVSGTNAAQKSVVAITILLIIIWWHNTKPCQKATSPLPPRKDRSPKQWKAPSGAPSSNHWAQPVCQRLPYALGVHGEQREGMAYYKWVDVILLNWQRPRIDRREIAQKTAQGFSSPLEEVPSKTAGVHSCLQTWSRYRGGVWRENFARWDNFSGVKWMIARWR